MQLSLACFSRLLRQRNEPDPRLLHGLDRFEQLIVVKRKRVQYGFESMPFLDVAAPFRKSYPFLIVLTDVADQAGSLDFNGPPQKRIVQSPANSVPAFFSGCTTTVWSKVPGSDQGALHAWA